MHFSYFLKKFKVNLFWVLFWGIWTQPWWKSRPTLRSPKPLGGKTTFLAPQQEECPCLHHHQKDKDSFLWTVLGWRSLSSPKIIFDKQKPYSLKPCKSLYENELCIFLQKMKKTNKPLSLYGKMPNKNCFKFPRIQSRDARYFNHGDIKNSD